MKKHAIDQDVSWSSKNLRHSLYLSHRISERFQTYEGDLTEKKMCEREHKLCGKVVSDFMKHLVVLLHGVEQLT